MLVFGCQGVSVCYVDGPFDAMWYPLTLFQVDELLESKQVLEKQREILVKEVLNTTLAVLTLALTLTPALFMTLPLTPGRIPKPNPDHHLNKCLTLHAIALPYLRIFCVNLPAFLTSWVNLVQRYRLSVTYTSGSA